MTVMATKNRGRPRGRARSGPYLERYTDREARGWGATQILNDLVAAFPEEQPPELRTIQRWLKEDRTDGSALPWRIAMTPPEDVPAVFAVIAAVQDQSEGRVRWVSAVEAEWIVRIQKLGHAVGMDPFLVYTFARRAARSELARSEDYTEDMMLGMATGLLDVPLGVASLRPDPRWPVARGPD